MTHSIESATGWQRFKDLKDKKVFDGGIWNLGKKDVDLVQKYTEGEGARQLTMLVARHCETAKMHRREIVYLKRHLESVANLTKIEKMGFKMIKSMGFSKVDLGIAYILGLLHDVAKYDDGRESDLRLTHHGEWSAEVAGKMLQKLKFSEGFITRSQTAIRTHMGMPFVETKLKEEWRMGWQMPESVEMGLDGFPRFILPPDKIAAYLYAADLLSLALLANPGQLMIGEALNTSVIGGGFDRIVYLNFRNDGRNFAPFGQALSSAFSSVEANVNRLCNPPERENREAMLVERFVGEQVGRQFLVQLRLFLDFIEMGTRVEVVKKGFPKFEPTMINYYMAVSAWREMILRDTGVSPSI